MTRPKPSRYKVASFGPELLGVLLKGARERVEIPCPDQRTMKFLQFRLQMLRSAMYTEGHPNYELVTRARTMRTWNKEMNKDSGCVLVVQPHDIQFADIVRQAGVTVDTHTRDILEDVGGDQPPVDSPSLNPYAKFKE